MILPDIHLMMDLTVPHYILHPPAGCPWTLEMKQQVDSTQVESHQVVRQLTALNNENIHIYIYVLYFYIPLYIYFFSGFLKDFFVTLMLVNV